MFNVIRVMVARARMRAGLGLLDVRLLYRGHFLLHPIRLTGAAKELSRLRLPGDVAFQSNVTVSLSPGTPGTLTVGDNCYVGDNCFISVHDDVRIGSDVMIGANCYITSAIHNTSDSRLPMTKQGFSGKSVRIGDDVWIGTGVVVLPGVEIGRGAVIGAGSVVTKPVPPREVWAGVPATRIKVRAAHDQAGAPARP